MRDQCGLFKILTSFIRLQKDGADLDAIPCTVTRKKNRRLEINLPSQNMHAPAIDIYAMHNFCRAICPSYGPRSFSHIWKDLRAESITIQTSRCPPVKKIP